MNSMNLFHILSALSSVGLFIWFFLWIGFKLSKYVGTHPEGKKQALSNIMEAPSKFSKRLEDEVKELQRKRALEPEPEPEPERVKIESVYDLPLFPTSPHQTL